MKYIKTADGIWEVMEVRPDYGKTYWSCKRNLKGKKFEESEIIDQADTIEELCDEMVVKYKDEPLPRLVHMQEMLKSCRNEILGIEFKEYVSFLLETYGEELEYIVGAIWIGEGNLKAVAKFNEKGELWLLS